MNKKLLNFEKIKKQNVTINQSVKKITKISQFWFVVKKKNFTKI